MCKCIYVVLGCNHNSDNDSRREAFCKARHFRPESTRVQ